MRNKTYALEWLERARHDLEAAEILYKEDHFSDVIGMMLQQAIEKSLKAIQAFLNQSITMTHELVDILDKVRNTIEIKESYYTLCNIATDYYREDRYPNPYYTLPERDEIKEVLAMATDIYAKVEMYINS